ncbi:hypothetical protein HY469_05635 [Candidatus Roizmanbacteria bacterium]|nr:hypothetical protein [Candidatus Roizmanbacteria bacterium]
MSKLFYDHLIKIEEIMVVLDEYHIPDGDRDEILSVIDETIHHHVLDVIFTHLPEEHHQEFMGQLVLAPHSPKLLDYIQQKTNLDIEQEIHQTLNQFIKEVIQDMQNA